MAQERNKLARKAIRSSYFLTVMSISMVLFLLGVLGVLVLNAKKVSDYFKENFQVSLILKPAASEEEINALLSNISASPTVKSVHIITKDEAARKLSGELGEDFISFLGTNPLSHTIDVIFKAEYAEKEHINAFVKNYQSYKNVQEIRFEQSLMEILNKNLRKISIVILGFGGILFLVTTMLINNTIRLSLYARRFLIKSMQLVGATRGFICRPFLKKGILSGFYGALIADILLIALLYFTQKAIPEMFGLDDVKSLLILMSAIIFLGIFLSLTSTFLAVNKYLRKSYNELF